ncbi:type II secretion system secretin GspD [Maridesulfovibrio zosterae]|uniref:type II secretion system secretin GspD n=1 Tax=Maridesulfovibrio zosterae TaxID=82171 RepID=UPI000480CFEB|nr:type II secretion system secretin GspD [Maridesulfovibrio zosterae]
MKLHIRILYKILVSLMLVMTLLSSWSFAQPEGEGSIHANLESISLVEFIKFVGRYTGRNIVFNAGALPGTNISVYAGQSLSEPELIAVFQEVLSGSGFFSVTRDGVTYILPQREAQKIAPNVQTSPSSGDGDEMITSIFQLNEKADSAKVAALLAPFASKIGQVRPVPMASAVLVRDLQSNVTKMKKLLKIILKAAAGNETAVLELVKSNSKVVASKLNSFYKKLSSNGKVGVPPVIEAVEWANSLLVSGTDDQIQAIRTLISELDKSDESYSKLKVYRLHNIEATVAGEVLKSLLNGGSLSSKSGSSKTDSAATTASKSSSLGENSGDSQVSADESTNSLIVMAEASKLAQIDKFVEQLDQAQDQVYIEALVLETTLNNAKEFGVEWQGGIDMGGSVATLGYTKTDGNLNAYASNPSTVPGGYSMGVLGDTISYAGKSFPTLGALVNFTKSATDFNLISAPQIMTLDNSEAEIFVGENRPYKTGESSTSGDSVVSTYSYKDVGIKLKITPRINPEDGLVKLDVYQTYNTVSGTSGTLELPVTKDRTTQTSVLLADGSTMVIGGLIQSDQSKSTSGVPYLSDLPLLGWLFKSTSRSGSKNTLMVFLSARIIRTNEQLEALSKAKMDKYRKERERFDNYMDNEFNTYKNDEEKSEDPVSSSLSNG